MVMNHYLVEYADNGDVLRCELLTDYKSESSFAFVVEANSEQEARKRTYNLYCAKKKKFAKERNYAAGKCDCGRENDRNGQIDRRGHKIKSCTVCAKRQIEYNDRARARVSPVKAVRDEQARVDACTVRVRDRKEEIRLEVLVEVQKAWQNNRTVGGFTRWLDFEIKLSVGPKLKVV